jgi:hypothetical protein
VPGELSRPPLSCRPGACSPVVVLFCLAVVWVPMWVGPGAALAEPETSNGPSPAAAPVSYVPPPTPAEQWVREPYRVVLDLQVLRDGVALPQAGELRVRARLEEALALTFESLWTLVPDAPDAAPHKRLRIEMHDSGGRWAVRAREQDTSTDSWSEWVEDRTADDARVPLCAAGLARRCFRPIALIDSFRGVAVRGAGHWPTTLTPPEARPLEIWLVYLNKSRAIEKRQRAPWSYLVHEPAPEDSPPPTASSTDPAPPAVSAAKWRVVAGVRGSLGARGQRVLAVGLAVSTPVSGTKLVLRPWKSVVRRIPGLDLVLTDRPGPETNPPTADSKAPASAAQRLVSDRRGEVLIPVRGDRLEVRQLEVLSGKQVLARLPILPGARAEDVLELPDDELRLRIEGDLAILQAGMIDIVSRRAVLMARARRDARLGQWGAVEAGLKSLGELPTAASISAELTRLEGPALEQAKRDRDRVTQSRIKRLCAETRDTLNRFLSDDPVKLLRDEIGDLRAAVDEQSVPSSTPRKDTTTPPANGATPAQPAPDTKKPAVGL